MTSDWRRPRAGPDAHQRSPDHHAAYPTLPSVAELLSSRPHHHPAAPFATPTSPALSIPHAASVSATSSSTASSAAASWYSGNPQSPPISPTDRHPARTYQEPQLRRQHSSSRSAAPRDPSLSFSFRHSAQDAHPPRPLHEARQDSAIFYKPIETCNDAQSSSVNYSHSHRSPADNHPPTDPAKSHGYFVERPAPVDFANGSDPSVKTPGSASVPDNSSNPNTHTSTITSTNGTRNHRYNVRFAVNYTSDNMPSSQKARTESSTAASVPSPTTEQQTVPVELPVVVTKEQPAPAASSPTAQEDSQPSARSRDRESSLERCQGCDEIWRRPLPNLDSVRQNAPAESVTQLLKISQDMVESLRDQGRKFDAAHEDWRWRHSRCVKPASDDHAVRPNSPAAATIEPLEAPSTARADAVATHAEQPSDRSSHKRKPESSLGDSQQTVSKMRKVAVDSAPPVRPPAPTRTTT
jgi:hypothetical protein